MSPDLDLFQWAERRPTAIIIDAKRKFLAREVAFIRQIMVGYQPAKSGGGDVVDLSDRRKKLNSSRSKAAGPSKVAS